MVTIKGDGVVMIVPKEVADKLLKADPINWKVVDDGKGK